MFFDLWLTELFLDEWYAGSHALFEFTGFDRQGDEVQSVIFVRSGSLAMLGTW